MSKSVLLIKSEVQTQLHQHLTLYVRHAVNWTGNCRTSVGQLNTIRGKFCTYLKKVDYVYSNMKTCSVSKRYRHKYGMPNTSSMFQPNAHVLSPYFIKSLLHVSVCYRPSSRTTSYYLLKTLLFTMLFCILCFLPCVSVVYVTLLMSQNIKYIIFLEIQNLFLQ
jgi:hypothetical protein